MACAEKIHFRSHLFPTAAAAAATLLHKSSEDEREGAFGIVREQRSSGESPLYSSLDLSNSYICIKIRLSSLLASTV